MSFLNENTLILHERSHTGEQPYKCDYCANSQSVLFEIFQASITTNSKVLFPDNSKAFPSAKPKVSS
uniref:C2H2-type domain-containing protein n=1 Tax=Knipowitschia caucasica TaxID=637954 RepID=A0AAV2JCM0_KNICA